MTKDAFRSHCPINYAQEIFGDRWSLLIIRDLLFKKKRRYAEFLTSEENISTNILADRLERLEKFGLIEKIISKESPPRGQYSLTQKGVDLLPILLEVILWSAKHDDKTEAPPEFISRLKKNRTKVAAQIRLEVSGR